MAIFSQEPACSRDSVRSFNGIQKLLHFWDTIIKIIFGKNAPSLNLDFRALTNKN
jgi:hypothetical protein